MKKYIIKKTNEKFGSLKFKTIYELTEDKQHIKVLSYAYNCIKVKNKEIQKLTRFELVKLITEKEMAFHAKSLKKIDKAMESI